MKKYFFSVNFTANIAVGIAAISAAALFTACASDAPDFPEITSGTTVSALAELPPDTDSETYSDSAEAQSSEKAVTAILVSENDYPEAEDAVQTSGGSVSRQDAADEIEITVVYTSQTSQTEVPYEPLNSWNTAAKTQEEAEKTAQNAEASGFSARIISVDDDSISVEVLSEEWADILGSFVQIRTTRLENVPECSAGDFAEVFTDEMIGITEKYPPGLDEGVTEIRITERLNIELTENSVLARVVNCSSVPNGEHYAIVVQAFRLRGYGFETEISMRSNEEFSFGDWVKIDFAEDTAFMESYPMQVSEQYILGIEKV